MSEFLLKTFFFIYTKRSFAKFKCELVIVSAETSPRQQTCQITVELGLDFLKRGSVLGHKLCLDEAMLVPLDCGN